jgi:hypothetical protein
MAEAVVTWTSISTATAPLAALDRARRRNPDSDRNLDEDAEHAAHPNAPRIRRPGEIGRDRPAGAAASASARIGTPNPLFQCS